jgi:outer membrane protein assembly factor BamB
VLETLWSSAIEGPDYGDTAASEWLENPYLAGRITAPVVAGGLVCVAQSDAHRLVALDEATGRVKWEFTAEGRIDGPPTFHRGMCLFGCRSGWVYSLRASDGTLIWKLRVAPAERRISHYGQLESPWPVAGSVLVTDGLAYAAAGIHPHADGGIRVACFRPESGEVVWTSRFDSLGFDEPWPDPWDPRKSRPDSDPLRTIRPLEYRPFDLPVRDGDSVAVSRCLFDLRTGKANLQKASGFIRVKETGACLPRTAWHYGSDRILSPVAVVRGGAVFSTVPALSKLFRVDFEKGGAFNTDWVQVPDEDTKAGLDRSTAKIFRLGTRWVSPSADNRTAANRAMLAAGDNLFVATSKGVLVIHGVEDGAKRGELKLDLVAWDGLAAANGRLYVSTADGKVLCLGGATPLLRPKR